MEKKIYVSIDNLIMSQFNDILLNPIVTVRIEKIIKSYKRIFDKAFHIRGRETNKGIEIYTGYNSVEAAKQIGLIEVPVYVDDEITEEDAKECFNQYYQNPISNKIDIALETYKLQLAAILQIFKKYNGKKYETILLLNERFGIQPTIKEFRELAETENSKEELTWNSFCGKIILNIVDDKKIYEILKVMIQSRYILKEAELWNPGSILNLLKDVPINERTRVYPIIDEILFKVRTEYEEIYPAKKNKIPISHRRTIIQNSINNTDSDNELHIFSSDLINDM